MGNLRFFLISYLIFCTSFLQGQTLPAKPATALNKVILYSDSTFFVHSNTFYEEGTLFEIIGETRFEHEDEAQNQKFKWYQVKTPDEKTGWIFGDGIAVMVPESEIIAPLKPYHLKTFDFKEDVENVITWVAYIEGKDNFHKDDYLNPLYKEFYLVVTGQLGKSVHIQYAGSSAMGSSELQDFLVKDLTDDNIPEIILLKSSLNNGSTVENRDLEVYSFQAGSITKVYEERMNLNYQGQAPSPALYKFIEINNKTIRIAFIDYLNCTDYSLMFEPNELDETNEQCLEYVTYSFVWNEQQKKYLSIYEESRTYIVGKVKTEKGFLRTEPSYLSEVAEKLPPFAEVKIIQHFEKRINRRGETKVVPYLYVQSLAGHYGYIHAKDVEFQNTEHASILNQFYKNPPLNKKDWKVNTPFLTVKTDDGQIILTKKD